MHVASLDLCRELYEVSGWDDTDFRYQWDKQFGLGFDLSFGEPQPDDTPAYDLGFIVRKLPARIKMVEGDDVFLTLEKFNNRSDYAPDHYSAYYRADVDSDAWTQNADTPEDAAALLALIARAETEARADELIQLRKYNGTIASWSGTDSLSPGKYIKAIVTKHLDDRLAALTDQETAARETRR